MIDTTTFIAELDELTHPNPLNNRESVWGRGQSRPKSQYLTAVSLYPPVEYQKSRPRIRGFVFGTRGLLWLATLADKQTNTTPSSQEPRFPWGTRIRRGGSPKHQNCVEGIGVSGHFSDPGSPGPRLQAWT